MCSTANLNFNIHLSLPMIEISQSENKVNLHFYPIIFYCLIFIPISSWGCRIIHRQNLFREVKPL